MNKILRIEYILSIIGLAMIIIGLSIMILSEFNQERCYNLPLNEFYRDKSCLKYKERLLDD